MGSPKKQKKKFSKPAHPWQKERILAEKELLKEYGLNRKYEIWKMNSILKNFTKQAKNLITTKNPQVDKERSQLLTKLYSLGLLGKEGKIEDVLSLTLKNIMERRLQTLVFRKNMASSVNQARQFIVHEHISLGHKTITAPSYLVLADEEGSIQFAQGSIIANASHPIRAVAKVEKKAKKETKVEGKKEAEKKREAGGKETKTEEKAQKDKKEESKKKVPSAHDLKKQKEGKAATEKEEKKEEVKK